MSPLLLRCHLALSLVVALPTRAQPDSPHYSSMSNSIQWSQLSPIPDAEGFAGSFAGVSGGALLVAGGANFVGERWANSPPKKWYDSVFVLEEPNGEWQAGFKLSRPLGYGVSITTQDGLICIGGSDATRHYAEVFRLQWKDGGMHYVELPALPRACANACGAVVGQTIYVAGGLESPSATSALKTFWALDLNAAEPTWRELEPWPGPARMLAVAAERDGSFFLFSGCNLSVDKDGGIVRDFLRDAYRFTTGQGWQQLADLPRAAVAAPSPAPAFGESELLVLSGDDGMQVNFSPIQEHPGFPKDILAYNTATGLWRNAGSLPFSRATAPTAAWKNRAVIPNGEVRPRVRTPQVWSMEQKGN